MSVLAAALGALRVAAGSPYAIAAAYPDRLVEDGRGCEPDRTLVRRAAAGG